MGVIQWNNRSSDDLHVMVEHHPYIGIPERKMDVYSVPGRNGDIVISQDAYENVIQQYDLALIGIDATLPQTVRAVMEWLRNPEGYARLEDSYNPDVYRLAYYKGGGDIENRFNLLGRATVSFSCKPQRFLRVGELPIIAVNGMKLSNPSVYTAKPLIAVKGTGAAVLTVGTNVVTISAIGADANTSGEIDIDCDTMSAYNGSTNRNSSITITGEFPNFKEGETEISWTGSGVTSVVITPRWWIL